MPRTRDRHEPKSALSRILRNTALLLGGKGFGAICGLGYLAILTSALGLKGFGHFSLIFGTAQALIAIASFQTTRVIVRYGAQHVHFGHWERLGRLTAVCGLLDVVSALFGSVIAAVAIYGFGHQLSLNPAFIDTAFWFCLVSLWALVNTPTGVVRALDRFDLSILVEAVVPIGRLTAACTIWFAGPSVARFLFAWAAIDIIEAALYWLLARRLCPQALRLGNLRGWRQAWSENEKLGHFVLVTYTGTTLDALMKNGPMLTVGAFVSTKAAGLYRLASQISQALSKLSSLLARTVYAEVSRAHVAATPSQLRQLALQTSAIAGITGIGVVTLAFLAGKWLLHVIGGEDFEQGAVILLPLAIAASLDLAAVAFEPVLHSAGKVRETLWARLLEAVAMGAGLVLFLHIGPSGAAWAVALSGLANYLCLGAMAWRELARTQGKTETPAITTDAGVLP